MYDTTCTQRHWLGAVPFVPGRGARGIALGRSPRAGGDTTHGGAPHCGAGAGAGTGAVHPLAAGPAADRGGAGAAPLRASHGPHRRCPGARSRQPWRRRAGHGAGDGQRGDRRGGAAAHPGATASRAPGADGGTGAQQPRAGPAAARGRHRHPHDRAPPRRIDRPPRRQHSLGTARPPQLLASARRARDAGRPPPPPPDWF